MRPHADADPRLASLGALERECPVTRSAEPRAWNGVAGDSPVPIDVASTPRMRRFTDIWITERKRQLSLSEAS